jgi:nucleoid DNA-binding protein
MSVRKRVSVFKDAKVISKVPFIRQLATDSGYTQIEIAMILDRYHHLIKKLLTDDGYDCVRIMPYVSYRKYRTKPSPRRNPQNGESVIVPPRDRLLIRPSQYYNYGRDLSKLGDTNADRD